MKIIINSIFLFALCFLGACTENTFPPAISSYWQVSGLNEEGWIEFCNKPIDREGVYLTGQHNGSEITIPVNTLGQYLFLKRKGYRSGETHYEIKDEMRLNSQLAAFIALLKAKPSRVSYVRNIKMNKISLDDLPCTFTPSWDQALWCAFNDGRKFKNVPPDYQEKAEQLGISAKEYLGANRPGYGTRYSEGDDKIIEADDISLTYESRSTNEFGLDSGYWFHLIITGWGDVNGDGIEDLVCIYQDVWIGGTGGYTQAMVLTRLKKNGPLFELPVNLSLK